ncbi:hypothetical protein [Fluviicola sp.]|uniref:hypothetical protein n=1 Tax=Fluviicola sp. TaxID=1917219 RepID=UPI0031D8F0C3
MKQILLGFILLVYSSVFSQSTSIDFSMSFAINPSFTPGLDEIDRQGSIFQVKITATDLNDIGEFTVIVCDQASGNPITVKRLSKQELLTGTYTQNGLTVFSFPYLEPSAKYKVILEAQNSQQAYLPRIEKNFPSN